jgi:predicted SnoaL-like aldol condensation-catalyzing enzyme
MNSNEQLMERVVEIFNTGDLSDVDAIFSPKYIDHQKPPDLNLSGPEEFKQIVTIARTSMPSLNVIIKEMSVEDDKVTARLQWSSTDTLGKKISRETVDILRIENSRIFEHWGTEVSNTETM